MVILCDWGNPNECNWTRLIDLNDLYERKRHQDICLLLGYEIMLRSHYIFGGSKTVVGRLKQKVDLNTKAVLRSDKIAHILFTHCTAVLQNE